MFHPFTRTQYTNSDYKKGHTFVWPLEYFNECTKLKYRKYGGYTEIRTWDPIIMSDVL